LGREAEARLIDIRWQTSEAAWCNWHDVIRLGNAIALAILIAACFYPVLATDGLRGYWPFFTLRIMLVELHWESPFLGELGRCDPSLQPGIAGLPLDDGNSKMFHLFFQAYYYKHSLRAFMVVSSMV
jgi:hypothetical protein